MRWLARDLPGVLTVLVTLGQIHAANGGSMANEPAAAVKREILSLADGPILRVDGVAGTIRRC